MCATAVDEATGLPEWIGEIVARLPEWLSVEEFADAVGIGKTLASQLADDGHLLTAGRRGVRRVIRIHRSDVGRYLLDTLIRPTGTDTDTAPGSAA